MLRKRYSNASESSSVCQLFKAHNLYTIVTHSLLCLEGKGEGSAVGQYSVSSSSVSTRPYWKLKKTGMQYVVYCIDSSEQGPYIQSPLKLIGGS